MIWERVLFIDWAPPTTGALARMSDPRVVQFWDPKRLLSHAMGETSQGSTVWDWAGIYEPGVQWTANAPRPLFFGRTVVEHADPIAEHLSAALVKAR